VLFNGISISPDKQRLLVADMKVWYFPPSLPLSLLLSAFFLLSSKLPKNSVSFLPPSLRPPSFLNYSPCRCCRSTPPSPTPSIASPSFQPLIWWIT